MFERVCILVVRLNEFVDSTIMVGIVFVEYFVEIVLIECLPSAELESMFMIGVLLVYLLPYLIELLQGPLLLCIEDYVHSALAHQLIQNTTEQP